MNSVYLTGNLGRDASFKELEDGKKVTIFSIATTEKSKDKEFTTWHRIICWGVAADIAKHYKKGDRIFVQGAIRNRNFDKDGETRQITEINAFTVNKIEKFIKPATDKTPPRIEEIPF